MKQMGKIPQGWMPYSPIGNQVPGTRFIAFKVPLRETFVDKLPPEDRFTIPILLERIPDLGLIIDLTQTNRYYNKNEVLDRGVDYVKIPTPGQVVPHQQYVDRFFEVVDYYLDSHKNDNSLIGVHCTHGVNRTGYMLCRYLIQRLGYSFEEAVEAVGSARGHMIERSNFLTTLRDHVHIVQKKTTRGDLEEDSRLCGLKKLFRREELGYFRRRSPEEVQKRAELAGSDDEVNGSGRRKKRKGKRLRLRWRRRKDRKEASSRRDPDQPQKSWRRGVEAGSSQVQKPVKGAPMDTELTSPPSAAQLNRPSPSVPMLPPSSRGPAGSCQPVSLVTPRVDALPQEGQQSFPSSVSDNLSSEVLKLTDTNPSHPVLRHKVIPFSERASSNDLSSRSDLVQHPPLTNCNIDPRLQCSDQTVDNYKISNLSSELNSLSEEVQTPMETDSSAVVNNPEGVPSTLMD